MDKLLLYGAEGVRKYWKAAFFFFFSFFPPSLDSLAEITQGGLNYLIFC